MAGTIRKKIMVVILALTMVMSFMPVTIHAESVTETADFVTDAARAVELLGGSERVEYNEATKEITFKGVNFSTSAPVAVKFPAEVALVLQSGTVNHITSTYNGEADSFGILCKILTIYGEGTLEVTGGTSGQKSPWGSNGIYCSFDYPFYEGSEEAEITITGNPTIIAKGGEGSGNSNGIISSDLTISGGKVVASGRDANASKGIYATNSLTISGGEVTASSGNTPYGSDGIVAHRSIIISGGTVTASSGNTTIGRSIAINAGTDLEITGGMVTASAGDAPSGVGADGSYGMIINIADPPPIKISGGTVTATGGKQALLNNPELKDYTDYIAIGAKSITDGVPEAPETYIVENNSQYKYFNIKSLRTVTDITAAEVTGITAPVAGAAPIAAGSLATGDASYTVTDLTWQNSDDGSSAALTGKGKFKAASAYQAVIELTAAAGYKFQALTPVVNTGTAEAGTIDADAEGNKLTFTVTFDPTAALQVTGIAVTTQPAKLSYTEGTDGILALNGMVVTETNNDGSTASVTFTDGTAAGYATDPANGTALTNAAHNNSAVTVTHTASGLTAQTGNLAVNTVPPATIPGAPTILSVAGNRQVTISWSEVPESVSYNIYSSTISNTYTTPSTTAAGAVYSSNVTGLTNGTTYYFVVTSVGPGGESAFSNEVSATPGTVPAAPTDAAAAAGNGQAEVSFTPPADNGGSAITGYTVTSNPGNITAAGTGTTITVTGLSNGTTYTFTVTASNAAGSSPASEASNAVTPYRPSSGDSDKDSTPSSPPAPSVPPANGVGILINGKAETVAAVTTTKTDDKTVTTVVVDDKRMEEILQQEGNNAVVTIPVNNDADVVVGQLSGRTVKNMESKDAVLEIKTGQVAYTLPASQINIDAVSEQIGEDVELKDITVSVKISEPAADTVRIVEDTANENNYLIVVEPVEFEITCSRGDKTVEVSKFSAYVERLAAIPEGVDPSKITTGVILNEDGTFTHVPTVITIIDGKYYAKINSLTNSVYSVIYSPKTFRDVEKHWAKEAVNDMASRLVVSGAGEDRFEPDRDITRAEFAAIAVRALGLMRSGTGRDVFNDVVKDAWYYDAAAIAYEYGLIAGYGSGQFGPMDKITREQAMTMVARAMKITGPEAGNADSEVNKALAGFTDVNSAADYAKAGIAACVKTGIIVGRSQTTLAPKDNITRAEVAVIVRRLLQKSGLI